MKIKLTKMNMLMMTGIFALFVLLAACFVYAKESEIETVTAKINYYYYDENAEGYKGTRPYQAFVAHMQKGSDDIVETCPTVPGFKPYIYDSDSGEYQLTNMVTVHFNADSEINVFYKPTEVVYKIRLMKQILNSEEYTADILIVSSGLTGSIPKEFEKNEIGQDYVFPDNYTIETLRGKTLETAYEGFTLMYHQSEVIAADGSTEFECYYDRDYYHVNFDLGEDGYGVEPLYLPYDYPLTMDYVGSPKRAGFRFVGWAEKLDSWADDYQPVASDQISSFSNVRKDITYVAIWEPIQPVTYAIVYRNQGLTEDGGNYNYWGKKELTALPGTVININDDFIEKYDNNELNLNDYQYFTIDKEKTKSDNGTNGKVTVKGDGSTIITLYYSRNTYKIWYVYARHNPIVESSEKKLVPAKEINTDHNYVIAGLKNNHAVTWAAYDQYFLKQTVWDEDTKYVWSFEFDSGEANPDANGDYHVYVKNQEGKYLWISNENGNRVIRSQMVDASQKPLFTLKRYYDTNKKVYYWSLQQGNDANYLNDKGKAGTRIQGYKKDDGEDAWKWCLYDMTEKEYDQSVNKPQNIRIATRTGNGKDNGEDDGSSGGVKWNQQITDLPEIDDSLTTGSYTRTFTDSSGNTKTYVYPYIEIEAEYNANIENIWPMNKSDNDSSDDKLIHNCIGRDNKTYSFGSWAMNYYSPIRGGANQFGNIVGPYPTMVSGLIIDREDSETKYGVKLPYIIRDSSNQTTEILDEAAYTSKYPDGLPAGKEEVDDLAQIMYPWWTTEAITSHAYEIYYEPLPGSDLSGKITDSYFEEVYELNRTEVFTCAHNGTTRLQPYAYKGFETVLYLKDKNGNYYLADETAGIDNSKDETYSMSNTVPNFVENAANKTDEAMWVTKLHYKRKRSNISFYNYTPPDDGKIYTSIPYDTVLTEEANRPPDPDYPDPDAAQYYEFGGWYLSELHDDSEKVEWGSFTMPDHDIELYAYWKPKSYTVNFYSDETKLGSDIFYKYESYYGESIEETTQTIENSFDHDPEAAPTYTLSDGSVEKMTQVGWYYYDAYGNIHAFDPKTMTVSGDMDLFMRWSTTVPAEYMISYESEVNGQTIKIADDTTGYSFVGLTKTFKAKVENQLYDGYTEGFFPYTSSTSILMKTPNSLNQKTFHYANVGQVNYRIRYVLVGEDGKVNYDDEGKITNQEIADSVVYGTTKAVVTPQYKHVAGYVPMDYYITHIVTVPELSSSEYDVKLSQYPDRVWPQNEIIFRYKVDTFNMPYHVKYFLEDENGSYAQEITEGGNSDTHRFRQINYIDNIGPKDSDKTVPLNHYAGYQIVGYLTKIHRKPDIGEGEEIIPSDFNTLSDSDTSVSFPLTGTDNSIEVYIYYLKKTYPVKVTYSIASENPVVQKQWYDKLKENSVFENLTPDLDTKKTVEGEEIYTTLYKIVENQKYDTTYEEHEIPSFSEFRLSEDSTKLVIISHDDGSFVRNKISLVWMEIDFIMYYYHAVIPDREGLQIAYADDPTFISMKLIDVNQENVKIYKQPQRSVTAKEGTELYRFKSWYKGAYDDDTRVFNLTEKITGSPATLSADGRTILAPGGANTDQHYFALYDYIRGDLMISTDGCDTHDMTQSFEYLITGTDEHNNWISLKVVIMGNGTKTIKGLPIGHYSVRQTGWSWRYLPSSTSINVEVKEAISPTPTASFTQTMTHKKWLDGNAYKDNIFSDSQ